MQKHLKLGQCLRGVFVVVVVFGRDVKVGKKKGLAMFAKEKSASVFFKF